MDHYAFVVADSVPEFFLLSFYASQLRQQNLKLVLRLVFICKVFSYYSAQFDWQITYVSVGPKLAFSPLGTGIKTHLLSRVHLQSAQRVRLHCWAPSLPPHQGHQSVCVCVVQTQALNHLVSAIGGGPI